MSMGIVRNLDDLAHNDVSRVSWTCHGAGDIRTLMDKQGSMRSEKRTALIAWELEHYQLDIVDFIETRLAGKRSVAELKRGYIFFWKGKAKNEDRIRWVGLTSSLGLFHQPPDMSTFVNERLVKLHFSLNSRWHTPIICAYEPTLESSDEAKDSFYTAESIQGGHNLLSGCEIQTS